MSLLTLTRYYCTRKEHLQEVGSGCIRMISGHTLDISLSRRIQEEGTATMKHFTSVLYFDLGGEKRHLP